VWREVEESHAFADANARDNSKAQVQSGRTELHPIANQKSEIKNQKSEISIVPESDAATLAEHL